VPSLIEIEPLFSAFDFPWILGNLWLVTVAYSTSSTVGAVLCSAEYIVPQVPPPNAVALGSDLGR
jgi:hypothetical protein